MGLGVLVSLAACDRETEPVATPTPSNTLSDATYTAPEADNTARNKVDLSGDTKTPLDQSESSAAIKVTAEIRRAIMDDDNLSVNAQNCKIITDETGRVTLRGVVNSPAEKNAIYAKAQAVPGVTRVDNQLEVKTN
ncbi:MAG: BON domain-containing protein [Phycisphaeraceae bacterium]|nr:BON domain-containing protein [Phycisphaeraceae bacterium]